MRSEREVHDLDKKKMKHQSQQSLKGPSPASYIRASVWKGRKKGWFLVLGHLGTTHDRHITPMQ